MAPKFLSPTSLAQLKSIFIHQAYAQAVGVCSTVIVQVPSQVLTSKTCSIGGANCMVTGCVYGVCVSNYTTIYTPTPQGGGSCTTDAQCSSVPGSICQGNITGNFYIDDSSTATLNSGTGLCQSASATASAPPGGTTVQAIWNSNTTTGTFNGSAYSINNIGVSANTIVSTNLPIAYRCTCPAGCSYSGIPFSQSGVNFYFTNHPLPWWQSSNGYVYAAASSGTAIQSQIPATCTGSCIPAVSKYDSTGTLNSDSTSLSGGGAINSSSNVATPYSYLNQSGTNTHAQGITLNGPREDYNYFSQLYGITSTSTVDFTGPQPSTAPTNGNAYYANSSITISTPWTINTATSIVVFVNGNLTIAKPILVARGGFVAFIVSGNIIFDKSLGSNSSNTPSAEGVYVASGQIITQTATPADDLKFIGNGTFVGWSGISLQRSFNNANIARGNTESIETFNYRPDLLLSVPTKMTKPIYLWQETN